MPSAHTRRRSWFSSPNAHEPWLRLYASQVIQVRARSAKCVRSHRKRGDHLRAFAKPAALLAFCNPNGSAVLSCAVYSRADFVVVGLISARAGVRCSRGGTRDSLSCSTGKEVVNPVWRDVPAMSMIFEIGQRACRRGFRRGTGATGDTVRPGAFVAESWPGAYSLTGWAST